MWFYCGISHFIWIFLVYKDVFFCPMLHLVIISPWPPLGCGSFEGFSLGYLLGYGPSVKFHLPLGLQTLLIFFSFLFIPPPPHHHQRVSFSKYSGQHLSPYSGSAKQLHKFVIKLNHCHTFFIPSSNSLDFLNDFFLILRFTLCAIKFNFFKYSVKYLQLQHPRE